MHYHTLLPRKINAACESTGREQLEGSYLEPSWILPMCFFPWLILTCIIQLQYSISMSILAFNDCFESFWQIVEPESIVGEPKLETGVRCGVSLRGIPQ